MATTNLPGSSPEALPDDVPSPPTSPNGAGKSVSRLRQNLGRILLAATTLVGAPLVGYKAYERQQQAHEFRQDALGNIQSLQPRVQETWAKLVDPNTPPDQLGRHWQALATYLNAYQRSRYMVRHPYGMIADVPTFIYDGEETLSDLLDGTDISPEEFVRVDVRIRQLEKAAANSIASANTQSPDDSSLAQGQE